LRPQLPILLVTGYASEATPTDELPADVPTLRKPFDQAALAGALAALLGPEPGAAAGVEDASPTAPAADGEARSRIMNTTTEPRPQ
ncbi:MAG TPA: hybrid sensor histidine kinase/response regulator, partial [Thauera aminoaromatica]|nr:hybrid sensor histidine kinase/response regulator [Thauera aminoaromatica]